MLDFQNRKDYKPHYLPPDPDTIDGLFENSYPTDYSAVLEHIDNAQGHAFAKNIRIFVEREKNRMIISHDGKGMDDKEMRLAMQIKRNVKQDKYSNGKFGYGLKASQAYLSHKFWFISKKGESFYYAKKGDNWDTPSRKVAKGDAEFGLIKKVWKYYAENYGFTSGTIWVFADLRIRNNGSKLIEHLKENLKFVYFHQKRKFDLFVNDEKIDHIDILATTHSNSETLLKNSKFLYGKGNIPVELSVFRLPEGKQNRRFNKVIYQRKGRLIAHGVRFALPNLNQASLSHLQIVVNDVDGKLDEILKMLPNKTFNDSIEIDRKFTNWLKKDTPLGNILTQELKEAQKKNPLSDKVESYDGTLRHLASIQKFMDLEFDAPVYPSTSLRSNKRGDDLRLKRGSAQIREKKNVIIKRTKKWNGLVDVQFPQGEADGPEFEYRFEGRQLIIEINRCHPINAAIFCDKKGQIQEATIISKNMLKYYHEKICLLQSLSESERSVAKKIITSMACGSFMSVNKIHEISKKAS